MGTRIKDIMDRVRELKKKKKVSGSYWTRTKSFQKLCHWAFHTCDTSQTNHLSKDELYSGLLLVYINIARYAGPAACYPPSREVVDTLFDACDVDNSGSIEKDEFVSIMVILSSQLTSRIVTYYVFLILLLPYFVDGCMDLFRWTGLVDVVKGMMGMDGASGVLDKSDSTADATLGVMTKMMNLITGTDGAGGVLDKTDSMAGATPGVMMRMMNLVPDTVWEQLPESVASFAIFSIVIPFCWNWVDEYLENVAERKKEYSASSSS